MRVLRSVGYSFGPFPPLAFFPFRLLSLCCFHFDISFPACISTLPSLSLLFPCLFSSTSHHHITLTRTLLASRRPVPLGVAPLPFDSLIRFCRSFFSFPLLFIQSNTNQIHPFIFQIAPCAFRFDWIGAPLAPILALGATVQPFPLAVPRPGTQCRPERVRHRPKTLADRDLPNPV